MMLLTKSIREQLLRNGRKAQAELERGQVPTVRDDRTLIIFVLRYCAILDSRLTISLCNAANDFIDIVAVLSREFENVGRGYHYAAPRLGTSWKRG